MNGTNLQWMLMISAATWKNLGTMQNLRGLCNPYLLARPSKPSLAPHVKLTLADTRFTALSISRVCPRLLLQEEQIGIINHEESDVDSFWTCPPTECLLVHPFTTQRLAVYLLYVSQWESQLLQLQVLPDVPFKFLTFMGYSYG